MRERLDPAAVRPSGSPPARHRRPPTQRNQPAATRREKDPRHRRGTRGTVDDGPRRPRMVPQDRHSGMAGGRGQATQRADLPPDVARPQPRGWCSSVRRQASAATSVNLGGRQQLWPSSICRARRSAPWLSRWVAKACRRPCEEMRAQSARGDVLLDRVQNICRVMPSRTVANSASQCRASAAAAAPPRPRTSRCCASAPIGTRRSLPPLRSPAARPGADSPVRYADRPTSCAGRSHHQFQHAAVAQASGLSSGAASRRSMSPSPSAFGRLRGGFGASTSEVDRQHAVARRSR